MFERIKFICVLMSCLFNAIPLLGWQLYDQSHDYQKILEGELGQSGALPWLGVLRVHLRDSFKVALTGLVLIKDNYAIAIAEDIVKIPRYLFRYETNAMFIPKADEPWSSRPKDYMTHPEYDAALNTIALIELDDNNGTVPFKPICWPKFAFNVTFPLYILGYSDDENKLGKTIHKLQYMKKRGCDAFYVRAGFLRNQAQPMHIQCGVAKRASKGCMWENGMVVATNFSGTWTLIGFSIEGPACTMPVRYLDMFPYLQWIKTSINPCGKTEDSKKSAFGAGFKKIMRPVVDDTENIPLENTFFPQFRSEFEFFPYKEQSKSQPYFIVDRVDKDAININVFHEQYESKPQACASRIKTMVYRDRTKIVANSLEGKASYRLTLYDMLANQYNCVKLKVQSKSRTSAKIWWMEYIDRDEGVSFKKYGETPKDLVKIITSNARTAPPKHSSKWIPGRHLEPQFLDDAEVYNKIPNVNLLVSFSFKGEAELLVFVYGVPVSRATITPMTDSSTRGFNQSNKQL